MSKNSQSWLDMDVDDRGEFVVRQLCNGVTSGEIAEMLDVPKHVLEVAFERIRKDARLPYEKRVYAARRDDILANLARWMVYRDQGRERHGVYLAGQVDFRQPSRNKVLSAAEKTRNAKVAEDVQ